MYALNARTPPPTPDAHLTYMKHRANGEVMGKSLIDYIITTQDVAMPRGVAAGPTATVGRKLVSTDHMPVFANIQRVLVRRTACEKFRLKLNATSKDFVSKGGEPSPALEAYLASVQAVESAYSNFVSALQSGHAASQVSATSAVQQAHEALIGAIRHAVNASFGYKHVATGRCVPWWSQDLTDAIQDRTKAFEAFRESCLAQDWHIYQSKRKAAHKLVAAASMLTSRNCLQLSHRHTMTGSMMTVCWGSVICGSTCATFAPNTLQSRCFMPSSTPMGAQQHLQRKLLMPLNAIISA
eukprot:gene1927-biopygen3421